MFGVVLCLCLHVWLFVSSVCWVVFGLLPLLFVFLCLGRLLLWHVYLSVVSVTFFSSFFGCVCVCLFVRLFMCVVCVIVVFCVCLCFSFFFFVVVLFSL